MRRLRAAFANDVQRAIDFGSRRQLRVLMIVGRFNRWKIGGMFNGLLLVGDVIAAAFEGIFVVCVVTVGMVWAVSKKKLPPLCLAGWAPITIAALIVSQAPWDRGNTRVVARQDIGHAVVAVTQFNDGLGDCNTQLWHKDEAGQWSGYLIDNDAIRWSSAGFRYISSNRIDVTRWGLVVGSFDPIAKKFCFVSSGVVFDPFASSDGHP